MYAVKLAAIVALSALGCTASDVYSTFIGSDGNPTTGTNFDVANNGCFSPGAAYQVRFSQASNVGLNMIDGPYCKSCPHP